MKTKLKSWYIEKTKEIYSDIQEAERMSDRELAALFFARFDGSENEHGKNIRASKCNSKIQPYVSKML